MTMSDSIDKWMKEWCNLVGTASIGKTMPPYLSDRKMGMVNDDGTITIDIETEFPFDNWEDIENIQKLQERKEKIKKIINRQ